jgi:hypothetical protein
MGSFSPGIKMRIRKIIRKTDLNLVPGQQGSKPARSKRELQTMVTELVNGSEVERPAKPNEVFAIKEMMKQHLRHELQRKMVKRFPKSWSAAQLLADELYPESKLPRRRTGSRRV